MKKRLIIIGAGASGMFAALVAAGSHFENKNSLDIIILDANDTPGKNDMFEHIDRSEQVRVYPSSISDEKNVSATDIPLPEPEAVENSKSFPSAAIAIISSSGATVLLLIFIAVWLRNRTRRKGKVTDNESNT